MKILVSTDSSCLVNNEMLKKYEISVFPLNVIIDGEEFLDGVTINQDQLCEAMRGKKVIKTSTPGYGTVIEYFDNLFSKGYDHIIHFTISSKLSSMFNLFTSIAEENYKGKLTVVDSLAVAAIMLGHVMYTYDEVLKGSSIDSILKQIEKRKETDAVYFIPENLNALKAGGRVSPTIAAIANTIGIKPIIILKNGSLEKDKMIKNVKHALSDLMEEFKTTYPVTDFDYSLIDFDAKESTVDYLMEKADEILGKDVLFKSILPINVCAHCGPGTIGLVVSPKVNGKSLKDYM